MTQTTTEGNLDESMLVNKTSEFLFSIMNFSFKGPVGFTSKGNRAGDTQIVQMKGKNIFFFKHMFLWVSLNNSYD